MAHAIAEYQARGVPLGQVYVVNPSWIDPRNIGFELGDRGWAQRHEIPAGQQPPTLTIRPLLFLFRPGDRNGREALRRLYPDGDERIFPASFRDRDFGLYLVGRAEGTK
jgi:hypothetical protein